jgi:maltooligosyltrehalose trehalohydrolase
MMAATPWRPSLGAWIDDRGVAFRVWAPAHSRVTVQVDDDSADARGTARELSPEGGGYFGASFGDLAAGARYAYVLDGEGPFPDPASRFQPDGVHGFSQVVDPAQFRWSDAAWKGRSLDEAVIYELHVGTFTDAGTFAAAGRGCRTSPISGSRSSS